ncbi:hypothetical protein HB772_29430 (plasmid) [Sinorhizobium meliloti]|nr:hypothetical protein HB772_29430 [Sinorhizobium meliloti]
MIRSSITDDSTSIANSRIPFKDQLLVSDRDHVRNDLIVPSEKDKDRKKELKALEGIADKINGKRNAIVHPGAFAEEPDTVEVVGWAREIVEGLVLPHHPGFTLQEKPTKMSR